MAGIDDILSRYGSAAPASAPSGIDAILAKYSAPTPPPVASVPEEPERKVGGLESLGRGLLQGVSFGLSDEITGGIESLFTDKTYRQARDEARKANEEARRSHEYLYGAGEIGGGIATALVPGVGTFGALGKGAMTVGKAAKLGAAGGALSGFGTSEADLTQGDVGGAVRDVATGAVLGAGTGAALGKLGEWAGRAGQRIDKRTMGDLGARAPKSIRDAMAALKPEVMEAVDDLGLRPITQDPAALQAKTGQALEDVSKKLTSIKGAADEQAVKATDVVKQLEQLRSKLADNAANAAKVKKLDGILEEFKGRYVPEPALTNKEVLRDLATKATGKQKERLGVRSGEAIDVIDTFGLRDTVKDPYAFQAKAGQAKSEVGKQIGEVYDTVQKVGGNMSPMQYVSELQAHLALLQKDPAKTVEQSVVGKQIDSINRTWGIISESGELEGYKLVPVREFRDHVRTLQAQGFGGGLLDPTAAKALKRELSSVAKTSLETHLEEVAARSPEARAAVDRLPTLNRQFSILKDFDSIAQKRVATANITPPPTSGPPPAKDGTVPVSELRRMIDELRPEKDPVKTVVQRYSNKKATASEKIADTLENIVNREIDKVTPEATKAIQTLEKQRTALDAINRAAEYRARLEPYPMTGLRDVQRETNLYGAARSTVSKVTGPAARKTDAALAKLISLAKRGGKKTELALEAAKLGVPRGMAQKIIERFTAPVEDDPFLDGDEI